MGTGTTILPIISGKINTFSFFHNYVNTFGRDKVLIQLEDNKLVMIEIDSISYEIKRTRTILYMNKLISGLAELDLYFRECNLFPEMSCGVNFGTFNSIFVTFQDLFSKTRILMQVNTDDEFQTIEVIPITSVFKENRKFVNVSVNKNIAFTDVKQIQGMNLYIVYIDYIPKKESELRGIKVAVSRDEKNELGNFCSKELLDTKYPVIDLWTNEHILFSKLPEDVIDTKINFSTGLTFLKFRTN